MLRDGGISGWESQIRCWRVGNFFFIIFSFLIFFFSKEENLLKKCFYTQQSSKMTLVHVGSGNQK